MRSIDTRFWSDGWVRKLNPLDRYLFLYLLTNDKSNWCGIYELEIGMMAYECGLDERDLERALLPRLVPKAIYLEGWVYIPNFPKYHLNGTEATKKGYEKAFSQVPEKIRLRIREIEETGVGGGCYPSSASAFALASSSNSGAEPPPFLIIKEGEESEPRKKEGSVTKEYAALISWLEGITGVKIINRPKQYTHLAKARLAEISKTRLKKRAQELLSEAWYQEHGLDWGSVVSSFDRKA